MRLTRHANLVALAASVLLHGGAVYIARSAADSRVAPPDLREPSVTSPVYLERPAVEPPEPRAPEMSQPQPPESAKLPEPEPPPVAPPPTLPRMAPIELLTSAPMAPPRSDGFGELTGTAGATALHSLDGDEPMQARKGDRDQARLDQLKEEKAQAQPVEEEPAAPAAPEKKAAPAMAETPPPDPSREDVEVPQNVTPTADENLPGNARPIEVAMAEPRPAKDSPRKPTEHSEASQPTTPSSKASRPESAAAKSTSESDAFSTEGATEFRPGRVTAAFGRRVKTVRPKLSLAAQYDLLGMAVPRVHLRVRVDETGRVRHVSVEKSSGSTQIDEACVLAMYDWWFEPPRSSAGDPVSCELHWTITFRH